MTTFRRQTACCGPLAAVTGLIATVLVAAPGHAAEPSPSILGTVQAPVAKHRANAIVWVKQGPRAPGVPPMNAKMDQKGLVFLPRVLPVQKGAKVEFTNSDPVAHNVFTVDGEKYDLGTWPQGQARAYTFTRTGVYRQLCRVHDDMLAYVVVVDTPWFAVSDKTGAFQLNGLPPGRYVLGVWHEKLSAADLTVDVVGGAAVTAAVMLGPRPAGAP